MIVFKPFKNSSDILSFDVFYYNCYMGTYYTKSLTPSISKKPVLLTDKEYKTFIQKIELTRKLYE